MPPARNCSRRKRRTRNTAVAGCRLEVAGGEGQGIVRQVFRFGALRDRSCVLVLESPQCLEARPENPITKFLSSPLLFPRRVRNIIIHHLLQNRERHGAGAEDGIMELFEGEPGAERFLGPMPQLKDL